MKLTAEHLKLFDEWAHMDVGSGYHFKALEHRTGLLRNIIRSLVHDLRDEGYLEFMRGCFTDDGEPYGSAYVLTDAGHRVLATKENNEMTSKWYPIEVAPKNDSGESYGPWIMVFYGFDHGIYQARWECHGDRKGWFPKGGTSLTHHHHITHWMPLPSHPSREADCE